MSMNLWFSGYGLWQQWQEAHAYEQPILTSEDTFGCPTCGKVFTTKRSWKNHNAVHQGESLVCRLCGKQQSSRTNYTRHLKTQHGVDNTYQAVDETRDVDQVWNKLVKFFFCGLIYNYKNIVSCLLITHRLVLGYYDYGLLEEGLVSCSECLQTFKNQGSLIHHMGVHRGETTCRVCGKVQSRVANLRRHLAKVHGMNMELQPLPPGQPENVTFTV